MPGERNLEKLLENMSPRLSAEEFVYCTFQDAAYGDFPDLEPIGSFMESEGLTLVIPKSRAEENKLSYESIYKCITLDIHSDLAAAGLTAAFSRKLAEHGISANVVAGYFHDHIFVQVESAEKAMAALREFGR